MVSFDPTKWVIRFVFELMLKVIHFLTMKVKLSFLFSFVLVTSQLPVLQHGEKGLCPDVRFKGSVSSYIKRFVEQRLFIATFCRFKQYFYKIILSA